MSRTDITAVNCLISIIEDGGYANLILKKLTLPLPSSEIKAVYAYVYTVLEHLLYIDYVLNSFCKRQKRVVRNILRLGAAKLLYLETPNYAATSTSVDLCKHMNKPQCSGLVNAVMKKLSNPELLPELPSSPIPKLSLQYSCPEWIVSYFAEHYGIETAEAILSAKPTGMELRAQFPTTFEQLEGLIPVPFERGKLDDNCLRLERGIDVNSFSPFTEGKCTVQSQGSMCICRAVGDVENKSILDVCAAPGGKSAYLYSLSRGTACLTAWDSAIHRVELMKRTLKRLHVPAKIEQRDASIYYPEFNQCFDIVLVDAPCSGLGLLNEKPDIKYKKQPNDIENLSKIQAAILAACCGYVKSGGVLVYSTCTISPVENEKQVEQFLKEHGEFSLLPEKMQQLFPHKDGVDGFFYAVMQRCI